MTSLVAYLVRLEVCFIVIILDFFRDCYFNNINQTNWISSSCIVQMLNSKKVDQQFYRIEMRLLICYVSQTMGETDVTILIMNKNMLLLILRLIWLLWVATHFPR